MKQCALQLYTLRERMKTRSDLEATLGRVRDIGYPAVQVSGLNWDLISDEDMAGLCRELGLTICATHESAESILKAPEDVVRRLRGLGCRYTAYPYPSGVDFGDEKQVRELVAGLERSGRVLAEAGLTLAYHNHHLEFRKLGGRTILERIYGETPPEILQGEIDTYWVQYGGGDPVSWCHRLKGRLPLLHLKDYGINNRNEIVFCEIGRGNLDFRAILDAADEAGCEWYIVEQDACPGDEFDSVAESLEYIRSELVSD
jgi:sugar phosphate isomerase/epimerase